MICRPLGGERVHGFQIAIDKLSNSLQTGVSLKLMNGCHHSHPPDTMMQESEHKHILHLLYSGKLWRGF